MSAALKEFGWSAVNLKGWSGTAAENIKALDAQMEALAKELERAQGDILALGEKRDMLERVLDRVEDIAICRLGEADVVRHVIVQRIIRAYEEDERRRAQKAGKPGKRKDRE